MHNLNPERASPTWAEEIVLGIRQVLSAGNNGSFASFCRLAREKCRSSMLGRLAVIIWFMMLCDAVIETVAAAPVQRRIREGCHA